MTTSQIQQFLKDNGYKGQNGLPLTIDGKYGPQTTFAVKAYQKAMGLTVDGKAGPITQAKMSGTTGGGNTGGGNTGGGTTYTDPRTSTISHYNKTGDASAVASTEKFGLTDVNRMKELAGLEGIVDKSFLNKIFSDPLQLAFYVHAIAFGEYTNEDIVKDMKRLELASKGNKAAENLVIIDPDLRKSQYYATTEGKKALTDIGTIVPNVKVGGFMNTDFLQYGLDMPDELFKKLVPILDRNSQEFKDAVSEVQSAFYDLANAQIQATTEQEKAAADYNYKEFQRQIAEKYGIALSDDATKAWSQIEALQDTMNTRGISGSGIEAEGIDQILQTTRKADQRLRSARLTDEEAKKAAYYTSSASSAEIAGLSDADREKYGLKPSADIASQYDINNLRAKYPKLSEEELQNYRNSVLDENGNYRSTIYAKKYSSINANKISQKADAEAEVITNSEAAENSMYSNFDRSQPLSQSTPEGDALLKSEDAAQKKLDDAAAKKASNAVSNIVKFNALTGKPMKAGESYTLNGKTYKYGDVFDPAAYAAANKVVTPTVPAKTVVSNVPVVPKVVTPTVNSTTSTYPAPYKIVYGDTLSSIAAKNKTTAAALAKLNKISDPNKIWAGQTIKFN